MLMKLTPERLHALRNFMGVKVVQSLEEIRTGVSKKLKKKSTFDFNTFFREQPQNCHNSVECKLYNLKIIN
jgi:hypothetical protein